jgi:hypothetical protein
MLSASPDRNHQTFDTRHAGYPVVEPTGVDTTGTPQAKASMTAIGRPFGFRWQRPAAPRARDAHAPRASPSQTGECDPRAQAQALDLGAVRRGIAVAGNHRAPVEPVLRQTAQGLDQTRHTLSFAEPAEEEISGGTASGARAARAIWHSAAPGCANPGA